MEFWVENGRGAGPGIFCEGKEFQTKDRDSKKLGIQREIYHKLNREIKLQELNLKRCRNFNLALVDLPRNLDRPYSIGLLFSSKQKHVIMFIFPSRNALPLYCMIIYNIMVARHRKRTTLQQTDNYISVI